LHIPRADLYTIGVLLDEIEGLDVDRLGHDAQAGFGARFSQIFAPNGFPISGNGDMGNYFFNPLALTREMWRLSLGLGYRFNQNLLLKMEYTFEHGREQSGENRDHEDMFALEAAYKF